MFLFQWLLLYSVEMEAVNIDMVKAEVLKLKVIVD